MDTSQPTNLAQTDGGHIDIGSSMWSAFEYGLEKSNGRFAIICPFQARHHLENIVGTSDHHLDHLAWTYDQLRHGSSKLSATLQAHGVLPGSTIVAFITNSAEWALLWFTAAIGRYAIAFCDPRAVQTDRVKELSSLLEILKPSLVVVENESGVDAVSSLMLQSSFELSLGLCLQPRSLSRPFWKSLEDIGYENHGESVAPLTDDMERNVTFMFTSGTSTGQPKGVPRTVRNWLTVAANGSMLPVTDRTITSLTTLCFRIQANNLAIAVWHRGGTILIPDPMTNWERIIDAVSTYNINFLQPGMYQYFQLVESPSFSPEKFEKITDIYMGGDVLTTQLLNRWQTAFPNARIVNYFGLTEGVGCTGWPGMKVPNPLPTHQNVVCVGKAGPGAKLKIVGDNSKAVERNQTGELHIGGTMMTKGYLNGVQAENFYHDQGMSWIKTGDTAMMNEEGQLFVLGRTKDIINRIGVPIPPSIVEFCIGQIGEVTAQAVGLPSERMGEEVYVVLDRQPPGTSIDSLKEAVVKQLGAEFAVSEIFTLSDLGMSDWPRHGTEKILKKDLRQAVAKHLEISR